MISEQKVDVSLVKNRFRCGSKTYDNHAVVQKEMALELVDMATSCVPLKLNRVLEIGCGTGLLTREINSKFDINQFYANDLVEECESDIYQILDSFQINKKLFISGDASSISLPVDNDVVWSGATMQWISDLPSFFMKIYNSLSPSGYLVISSFLGSNFREIKEITGKGIDYQSLESILEASGLCFEAIDSKQWTKQLWFESPREVLKHMRYTGVNGLSSLPWTRSDLEQFERDYHRFKTAEGYPLTYHPVLMILKKKK